VALRLCVDQGYGRVSAGLERLWGTAPAPETLRQAALEEGAQVRAEQREATANILNSEAAPPSGAPPERLYITLHGGYVRGRAKGQWHEGKLGQVYPERRVTVSRNRRRVLGREQVGTFESAARLGEAVYATAFGQGVESARQVIVLRDGAAWIRTVQQEHFPRAELRLDAFHVLQALDRGLRAAYPNDRARQAAKKPALKTLIWEGRLNEALRRLRLIAHHASGPATALHETLEYLDRQAPYIPAYARLQERGEMISSALAEAGVDRTLNARFKHQHRHWRSEGAEALFALRLLVAKDQWDRYWLPTDRTA
jgi:hypothetical protein